jgi:hypothetical protein
LVANEVSGFGFLSSSPPGLWKRCETQQGFASQCGKTVFRFSTLTAVSTGLPFLSFLVLFSFFPASGAVGGKNVGPTSFIDDDRAAG